MPSTTAPHNIRSKDFIPARAAIFAAPRDPKPHEYERALARAATAQAANIPAVTAPAQVVGVADAPGVALMRQVYPTANLFACPHPTTDGLFTVLAKADLDVEAAMNIVRQAGKTAILGTTDRQRSDAITWLDSEADPLATLQGCVWVRPPRRDTRGATLVQSRWSSASWMAEVIASLRGMVAGVGLGDGGHLMLVPLAGKMRSMESTASALGLTTLIRKSPADTAWWLTVTHPHDIAPAALATAVEAILEKVSTDTSLQTLGAPAYDGRNALRQRLIAVGQPVEAVYTIEVAASTVVVEIAKAKKRERAREDTAHPAPEGAQARSTALDAPPATASQGAGRREGTPTAATPSYTAATAGGGGASMAVDEVFVGDVDAAQVANPLPRAPAPAVVPTSELVHLSAQVQQDPRRAYVERHVPAQHRDAIMRVAQRFDQWKVTDPVHASTLITAIVHGAKKNEFDAEWMGQMAAKAKASTAALAAATAAGDRSITELLRKQHSAEIDATRGPRQVWDKLLQAQVVEVVDDTPDRTSQSDSDAEVQRVDSPGATQSDDSDDDSLFDENKGKGKKARRAALKKSMAKKSDDKDDGDGGSGANTTTAQAASAAGANQE